MLAETAPRAVRRFAPSLLSWLKPRPTRQQRDSLGAACFFSRCHPADDPMRVGVLSAAARSEGSLLFFRDEGSLFGFVALTARRGCNV